jgi:hypothetical protein
MIQTIRCPNCGSLAERHHHALIAQVRTQCDDCDYLLVMCSQSGRVLESYAPGLPSDYLCRREPKRAIALGSFAEIYHPEDVKRVDEPAHGGVKMGALEAA